MGPLSELYAPLNLAEATIAGGKSVERRLSDLAGCFANQQAYEESLASGDQIVYRVSSLEPGSGPGDLHFGLGVLMPGRIGDEYFLTKGHLHQRREAAEVYLCLGGSGMMLLENEQTGAGQIVPMTHHSTVYVPGHTAHRTINTGDEPLQYIGVYPADAGHDYAGALAECGFRYRVVATVDGPKMLTNE